MISDEQWDELLQAIQRKGGFSFEFVLPPVPAEFSQLNKKGPKPLNERKRKFCYLFVKSGGNHEFSAKSAGFTVDQYSVRGRVTKMFKSQALRIYTNLCWETACQINLENTPVAEALERAESGNLPVPVIRGEEAKVPEILTTITESIRQNRPGLYYEVKGEGDGARVAIKPENVLKAPPGVIKTIKRNRSGEQEIEFYPAQTAAKSLLEFYQKSAEKKKDDRRVDIRKLIVNILSNPEQRDQLESLAAQAARQLREGAIDAEIVPLSPALPTAATDRPGAE